MNATSSSSAPSRLVFACSGAADVGHIADLAARQLHHQGLGRMYCLAGVGGRVPAILETTRTATTILAIDGCLQNCARKTLEQAGFTEFRHLQLADAGLVKGVSAPTPERVALAARRAAELLD